MQFSHLSFGDDTHPPNQRLVTFSLDWNRVNILDFASCVVSVIATQLYHCITKITIYNM